MKTLTNLIDLIQNNTFESVTILVDEPYYDHICYDVQTLFPNIETYNEPIQDLPTYSFKLGDTKVTLKEL